MRNIVKLFVLFSCLMVKAFNGSAQVNDAGLWTSINIEKQITKKIGISLSEEFRFNENISELGTFFTEVSGEYKFSKLISLSAGYRFINKRRVDDSYSIRHRWLANLVLRRKFGNINTALRLRYQSQYSDIQSSDEGAVPDNYLRTKLTVKYNTGKRITPFVSGEFFYHINRPEGMLFDNYRVSGGLEYEFSKQSNIEAGYMIDREINVNNPWTNYIIAVSWNYRLK